MRGIDRLFLVLLTGSMISCQGAPTPLPIIAALTDPLSADFHIHPDPVLQPAAEWDSGFMDPGAVLYSNGGFHMFYNAFRNPGLPIAVGYAYSSDGLTYSAVSMDPVLTVEDIAWEPRPATFHAGSVLQVGGLWVLYFSASNNLGNMFMGPIGRATAKDPLGPWTVDPNPVLEPGAAGEWDAQQLGLGQALRTENGFSLYYYAPGGIGLATSPDGIAWTKHDDPGTTDVRFASSDPILAGRYAYPTVARTEWGYAMVYWTGMEELHYAYSADGIHWTQGDRNPIVDSPDRSIWFDALLVREENAYLYFEAGTDSSRIYLATWSVR